MTGAVVYLFAPRPVLRRKGWLQRPEYGWERAIKVDLAELPENYTGGQYKVIRTIVDAVVPCDQNADSGCYIISGPAKVL